MHKIAIIHFSPIELYPPAMNFLNYIGEQMDDQISVRVFSMAPQNQKLFQPSSNLIRTTRIGQANKSSAASRYLNYLKFYSVTTGKLISWKPSAVVYFESLSAFPAIFYKRNVNSGCKLFIHYHEYTSPLEYQNGMLLNRWQHQLEKKIYSVANWVSHTNEDRMNLFTEDNKNVSIPNRFLLPNYPPRNWYRKQKNSEPGRPVKIVYIGALSLETMFVKEFAEWVSKNKSDITWDIYSSNITDDTRAYLEAQTNSPIRYHEGVDYFSLPQILSSYDVGVVLYKGHIPNYVYNAPNKLFEYLACGLDVWFPVHMKSALPFLTTDTFPQVKAFDFNKLNEIDLPCAVERKNLQFRPSSFFCEDVYVNLFDRIKN